MILPRTRICIAISLLLLGSRSATTAGDLEVNGTAAFTGAFGLEVTVDNSCIDGDIVIITSPPTISGTFSACQSLTVQGVVVGAAGAVLQAPTIALASGFAVPTGAVLSVVPVVPLVPYAFVTDESPASVTTYRAFYRLNLDPLSLAVGDSLVHLTALHSVGSAPSVPFEVLVIRNLGLGENRVVVRAEEDDGSAVDSSEMALSAGWNEIEVRWAAGAGSGSLVVSINGSVFAGLSHLDNDQLRVDRVLWGAVDGNLDASSGSFYLDDFSSTP